MSPRRHEDTKNVNAIRQRQNHNVIASKAKQSINRARKNTRPGKT